MFRKKAGKWKWSFWTDLPTLVSSTGSSVQVVCGGAIFRRNNKKDLELKARTLNAPCERAQSVQYFGETNLELSNSIFQGIYVGMNLHKSRRENHRRCLHRRKLILMNKGLASDGVTVFMEVKAGYFIKQYPDLVDFQKVYFMDKPEISPILLYVCCLGLHLTKSQNNWRTCSKSKY